MSRFLSLAIVLAAAAASTAAAGTFPYTQEPMPRDLILEIAHLYYDAPWRADPDNVYTNVPGAICPYTTSGWKETLPYCWAGADEIYEFFEKMTAGLGAGDRDTSSTAPYYSGKVGGVDCSGFASQCFRSGRYTTSTFAQVCDQISWDELAPGDAINDAGSHIRICEKYPTDTGLILVYESTGYQWKIQHRLLARDNNYVALRYRHASPMPSLLEASRAGTDEVTLRWMGAADRGFRVYRSTNGTDWTISVSDRTLGPDDDTVVVGGLLPDQLYLFRVVAVNDTGESGPSHVFPVQLSSPDTPRVLLVQGYDRWLRQAKGAAYNDFLARYATALSALEMPFDTCDNLEITRGNRELLPTSYAAVIWMLGEESTSDYTFNFLEIERLEAYLRLGGRLFVSGAEIGWDLIERESACDNLGIDESDFYHDFLKSDYINDNANSDTVSGTSGGIFAGCAFNLDDGTHGTYNVDSPDVIRPRAGRKCLRYGSGGVAGLEYVGTMPAGSRPARVVYLSFPYEAIYPEAQRDVVMSRVMDYFGLLPTPTPTTTPTWTATSTPWFTPTATPTPPAPGDVHVDGRFDSLDLLEWSQWWKQNETEFSHRADLVDDGIIDASDLLQLIELLR